MPAGFDVTVPAPTSALAIDSVYSGLNVAVAVRAAVIVILQVAPETVSHPLHPVNADPLAAVAVSVTAVPLTYGSEQSAPQLIPAGLEVTVPDPAPAFVAVSVNSSLNVAVTVLAAFIATVHVDPVTESHPVHPVKADPEAAAAVSVTLVSVTYGSEQSVPQLIPLGVDVTVPAPASAFATVSVKRLRVNVAVTLLAALIVTVQLVPATLSHPPQPAKSEFAAGEAVSVTCESLRNDAEQLEPQAMPAGFDETEPPPSP
jgi:hypothetical protein